MTVAQQRSTVNCDDDIIVDDLSLPQRPQAVADPVSELVRLPFDHYARYALTQRVVRQLRASSPEAPAFTVLDIGGHSSPLKHFVPAESVVLLDVEPPGSLTVIEFRYDEYVRGSGMQLPFADGAFDITAAHDTLEHIPAESRKAFLCEMLRVTRRFAILNGPVFQEATSRAEIRLTEFIVNTLAWEQPFLAEHLALGLPEREMIEDVLREQCVSFIQIPNGGLGLWLAFMAFKHYLASFSQSDAVREWLDQMYNTLLADRDIGGLCYREAYVCAKLPEDAEAMQVIRQSLLSGSVPAPVSIVEGEGDSELEGLLNALEQHAILMRSETQELHAALFSAEKKTFGVEHDLEQHRAALKDLQTQLAHQEELLSDRIATVQELRRQVEEIQSSIGYRSVLLLRRGIHSIFPPGSARGAPYRLVRALLRRIVPRNGR